MLSTTEREQTKHHTTIHQTEHFAQHTLRKHAHAICKKIPAVKNENFIGTKLYFFIFLLQTLIVGTRGCNEYSLYMFCIICFTT